MKVDWLSGSSFAGEDMEWMHSEIAQLSRPALNATKMDLYLSLWAAICNMKKVSISIKILQLETREGRGRESYCVLVCVNFLIAHHGILRHSYTHWSRA